MSEDRSTDPFDLFRALNPFDDEPDELSTADEQLLARILATPVEPTSTEASRPPTRRRLAVVAGLVATASLATAAFTFLRSEPVTNPTAVVCYATADVIDGDRVGLGSTDDPVAACSAEWRDGELRTDGSVPPLVGCVNEAGAAAVFPGAGDVCERLGLPNLEQGLTDDQIAITKVQDTLIDLFLDRCFAEDDAVAEARRQLNAAGLDNWTAKPAETFTEDLPCAGVGVIVDEKVVIVVGVRPEN